VRLGGRGDGGATRRGVKGESETYFYLEEVLRWAIYLLEGL
jgi:hypothetical protein